MHLQDALGHFQVQLQADGRSEHTRKQYQRHVASLIAWLTSTDRPTDIEAMTPAVVAEFFASDTAQLSARGGTKKATSANAQRTSLRCFFKWAHESGLAPMNAARLLKRARCSPPPPRALRQDEQDRLLAVLANAPGPQAERDAMLIRLLLASGIRIGSAIALDVGDIDFAHGEVTLRSAKGNRPATALLPKAVARKIQRFLRGRQDGPVFLAGDRRVSMRHAQRRIAGWLAEAQITGRSAHAFRHSFAERILSRTSDLRVVQAALNHRSIMSTTVYTSVDSRRLRVAVGR